MEIRSIGIDLGKTTFHLVALGRAGEVLVRKKFTQKQLLIALESRAHKNVLIVAFANKLARIAWAVLSSGEPYRPCRPVMAQS